MAGIGVGDAMAKPRDDCQKDLLQPALEDIVDLGHPLVRQARDIDWRVLDGWFAGVLLNSVNHFCHTQEVAASSSPLSRLIISIIW